MDTEWLSSTEVAEAAGMSRPALLRRVNNGQLPAYRIGRHYRFRRREVAAWLDDIRRPEQEAKQHLRAEAVRRYLDGEPSTSVGADLGVSPSSVTTWVRRAGGTVHRRG